MKRLWLVVAGVVCLGLIAIIFILLAPKPPIPPQVKHQVTSTIFVPRLSDVAIDRSTVKYDGKLKLLSFTAAAFGIKTVMSEQPTPDSFVDVPQVYDKVVASMNEYTSFDTDAGTVHLTRPTQLNGKQAAMLNSKGTLFFAKPDKDLTEDQWRKLFNSIIVIK